MKSGDSAFGQELEVFRTEEETAQQCFFAYLAIRETAARDEAVLRFLDTASLFWLTTEHALLLAAFVALGRVFDQASRHNVNRLLMIGADDLSLFSKPNLARRKREEGLTPTDAAAYVSNAYEPTSKDFRGLRKSVAKQRKIYETRYRDIRDKIFAHKEISHPDDTNALFKKTKIEEMKALFAFLHALHEALWELLFNGREPTLKIGDFVLPPAPKISGQSQNPGEEIAHEIAEFLTGGTND
jgi:hypothetical protein